MSRELTERKVGDFGKAVPGQGSGHPKALRQELCGLYLKISKRTSEVKRSGQQRVNRT